MRDYSRYSQTPTKTKHKTNQNRSPPSANSAPPSANHVSHINTNNTPNGIHNNHSNNNPHAISAHSPANSSVASYPVTSGTTSSSTNTSNHLHHHHDHVSVYRQHPTTVTQSQVAVLNRHHQQQHHQQQHQHQHHPTAAKPLHHQQQQQHSQQQKRDAGSISTAATQSSNDHSPRSNSSDDPQQQQQQQQPYPNNRQPQHNKSPQHHATYPSQYSQQQSPPHLHHLQLLHQQHHSMTNATTPTSQQQPQHAPRDLNCLTPADALSLKRDGPEATIVQLRQSLEEARLRDAAEKSNLAKSDATILELRSSVRQLKRQLEKLDTDARQKHADLQVAKQQLQALKQQKHDNMNSLSKEGTVGELQVQLDRAHAQILTADMVRKELEDTLEAEQYTWELRVQDQERTIVELQQEAGVLQEDLEQCRQQWKQADEEWTHKVQQLELSLREGNSNVQLKDKLRQVEEERNELQTCLDEALQELEAVDAELGNNNNNNSTELQQLRHENQRLQETVQQQRALQQAQQLQQGDADFDTLEGLQHLYRWLLERSQEGGEEKKNDTMPQTSPELLDAIHRVLETMPSMTSDRHHHDGQHKVPELEAQIRAYHADLQARDQAGVELRTNLQEAVALIKPLQDAVDKANQQKADLQQEIERLRADHEMEAKEMQDELRMCQENLRQREQECDQLHHDIHRLQIEVEDAKGLAQARQTLQGLSPTAAAAAAAAAKIRPPLEQPQELSSLSKARADLKAKRAQEQTLRSLLQDAQNRFHSLNQQNQNVEAMNQQLQGRLRDVQEHSGDGVAGDVDHVQDLEQQLSTLKASLEEKSREIERLTEQAQHPSAEMTQRTQELETQLTKTENELKHKLQSEKILNKSLKEALGLLKPLKNHLEEAEAENKEMSKEVKMLRRKITSMEISGMGTVLASPNGVNHSNNQSPQGAEDTPVSSNQSDEKIIREKEQLEETVRHLEQENSQLHDALDELSRMNNGNLNSGNANNIGASMVSGKAENRLNQEIVELKSRYEVTQSRLEDAYVENHTLVEALKEKEESEKDAIEGMRILREKLRKTEMDLQNAKYIATSALVKVEHSKSLENNISMNSAFETESHTVLSLEEKAIELDLMAAAGLSPTSSAQSPKNGPKPRQFHPNQHQHHPQQQQQPYSFVSSGGQPNIHKHGGGTNGQSNGWAGKRSRLADF
ncbi:BRCT domain protein [Seminavis robusta]|uniref:BRCT domain protein n=1 Tax=Seminavis robusta TaxID=568900 RepID=A0A9N8H4B6_9STRA|nr:BRCT domain protein [Seminavis robusta]|eukprot:Sro6_g005290.1 BRCT domain protein (1189) ;mRNA; r:144661-148227